MKLLQVIFESSTKYTWEYSQQVDKLKKKGGIFIDSGEYGSVYLLNGKAVKVTSDRDEIIHANILKGKDTKTFVHIHNVERINDKLGVITMKKMNTTSQEITPDLIKKLEIEAALLGIDPEELDIRPSNFMEDPDTGEVKMVDV
jgi:hypothetical protein